MSFPSIYGITDPSYLPDNLFFSKIESALAKGLQLLQYRDKSQNTKIRKQEASALKKLCERYNAKLIINDDIKLALEVKADGVHLGQEDESIRFARRNVPPEMLIGATCHNDLGLAQKAVSQGASYLAFGRFFPSKTKTDATLADLEILRQAREIFSLPIVAIGGINLHNAKNVWRSGAHCLALSQSLFAPDDPGEVVEMLLEQQKFIRE